MAVSKKEKQLILEYLREKTEMYGTEIMAFERVMKEKGVFKR